MLITEPFWGRKMNGNTKDILLTFRATTVFTFSNGRATTIIIRQFEEVSLSISNRFSAIHVTQLRIYCQSPRHSLLADDLMRLRWTLFFFCLLTQWHQCYCYDMTSTLYIRHLTSSSLYFPWMVWIESDTTTTIQDVVRADYSAKFLNFTGIM